MSAFDAFIFSCSDRVMLVCSFSGWEHFVEVFGVEIFPGRLLATFESSVFEREVELLGLGRGESSHDHFGVGVENAVHGQAYALNGSFVHLQLIVAIFLFLS